MALESRRARRNRRAPGDRALYVETTIHAPIERVWDLTQDPQQHARWDARFSNIVPTTLREDGAQEFRYELDLGIRRIRGTGVFRGERRNSHGQRTSALIFAPSDAFSPLGPGRGYWRYIPVDGGVRFLTGYDYVPGWGWLGRILDPLITRRFVWWLTAWSFDRLRLWAEEGIEPEQFPLWRALLPGRGPRPRARRCLSHPATNSRTIMQNAPSSLTETDL